MGCFVGYPKDSIRYEFYLLDGQKIIIGCQTHFLEEELFKKVEWVE